LKYKIYLGHKLNKQNQIIFFFPDINVGGVEKNFFIISKYLSYFFKYTYLITRNLNNKKISKKINIIPTKNFWFLFNRRLGFIICSIKLFYISFKLKNSIIFSFQGNFYAIIVAIILKKKIIIRSNLSPESWHGSYLKYIVFKYLLSKVDVIIVNSEDFRKQMKKVFNIKTTTIFNPVNIKEIKKFSYFRRKISFYKKNTINLINVGRLVQQKNQIEILIALKKLKKLIKNFRLLIIGYGPNKVDLENYISKNGLKKYVRIIFVKNPLKFINMSDVFILSSKHEGLPNSLLEAAYLNKYIIASNCNTGPKEILNEYRYGELYKVGNINHLYLKIAKLNKKKLINKKKNYSKNLMSFDYDINLKKYLPF